MKFKDLNLNAMIQKSLDDLGFVEPSPIQKKAIPFLLESKQDLIALAQTGTGKTAAFSLPILEQLEKNKKNTQAIILCPTRELCLQISKDVLNFAKYTKNISLVSVYGGDRIDRQIASIKNGADIVVGTPGRVHDLIRRKVLKLKDIRWLVLDEADEMLDMGFKDDLDAVLSETPQEKQTLLFSATMSKVVRGIAGKYMNDPEEISVGEKNTGSDNVAHEYYLINIRDRYESLRRIVDSIPDVYGILFCRTRRETQEVADLLKLDHYSAEALHGEITQNMRTQIMDRFKNKKIQLLVATDVAARGIDVNNLSHVINYNLPDQNEIYIHRSGRTGRAQNKGVSIALVSSKEVRKIRDIEKKLGKNFERKNIPSGEDICFGRLNNFTNRIHGMEIENSEFEKYLNDAVNNLSALEKDLLIKKFINHELRDIFAKYHNAKNVNVEFSEARGGKRDDSHLTCLKINLGRKDRFEARNLFFLINSKKNLKGAEIGKINVQNSFTLFWVDREREAELMKELANEKFQGRIIEISKGDNFSRVEKPFRKKNKKYEASEKRFKKQDKFKKKKKRY